MIEKTEDEPETDSGSKTARIASTDLFHGRREIVIVHRGTNTGCTSPGRTS